MYKIASILPANIPIKMAIINMYKIARYIFLSLIKDNSCDINFIKILNFILKIYFVKIKNEMFLNLI